MLEPRRQFTDGFRDLGVDRVFLSARRRGVVGLSRISRLPLRNVPSQSRKGLVYASSISNR
jgi:hypothetical protein